MSTVQTVKKIGKGLGIGFLVLLFIGAVGSSSEDSATIEHLQQENQELEQEVKDLESEIKALESQKSALNNEIDRLKEEQQEEPQVQQEEPKEEVQEKPKEEEPKEEPKSENYWIEKLDIKEVGSKEEYGILTVTVSLVADKNYTMLSVNIPLYDNEGYLIGNVTGYASDVKEGQKVKVECSSFETGIYKIEELDIDSF